MQCQMETSPHRPLPALVLAAFVSASALGLAMWSYELAQRNDRIGANLRGLHTTVADADAHGADAEARDQMGWAIGYAGISLISAAYLFVKQWRASFSARARATPQGPTSWGHLIRRAAFAPVLGCGVLSFTMVAIVLVVSGHLKAAWLLSIPVVLSLLVIAFSAALNWLSDSKRDKELRKTGPTHLL